MTAEAEKLQRSVSTAVARHAGEPGPLLEILHALQNDLGCVPPEAVPLLADALNLSRAEVHGVISFYHHFRQHAPGRYVVQLCRAEACQSMNARALEEFVRGKLHVNFGETTADGRVTLEAVYCLGNCACAPAMMVNGELHGRVTPERFGELAKEWG
ncbi:MAG TPA: formate dehydrogenase subunit gamma, partial [Steroidobacteraceae bacterium]|nr:formate dehydrogenase subunit gamma [Steroidobacteraceae bacterium]